MIKESWLKAEDVRVSKRSYTAQNIEKEKLDLLKNLIHKMNTQMDLKIQLLEGCQPLFKGFRASYGMIKGAHTCIALVVSQQTETTQIKAGYAGEMLVLEATAMGLGSCWIGGTYDKKAIQKYVKLNENEKLLCVIAIGYNPQNMHFIEKIASYVNRKGKAAENFLQSNEKVPTWVKEGISSVTKAPSALNAQPVGYRYEKGKVMAFTTQANHGLEKLDLGISMLHFEIGAKRAGYEGQWLFENNECVFK